jgi:hypothetical protein
MSAAIAVMAAAVRMRRWGLGAGRLEAMGWLVMVCLLLEVGPACLSTTVPPGGCGRLAELQQALSALLWAL